MANMIIHYICRGNAFRSFIAEAYTRSLELPHVTVISSGTLGSLTKQQNATYHRYVRETLERHHINQYAKADYADNLSNELIEKSDVIVCVNKRVYDEAHERGFMLPETTIVWDVLDFNEGDRIIRTEADIPRYVEMAYHEIVQNVDALVAELGLRSEQ